MKAIGLVRGNSYIQRVKEVMEIYDAHCKSGKSNREIIKKYIWPKYQISEKTFYNMVKASVQPQIMAQIEKLKEEEKQAAIMKANKKEQGNFTF